MKGRNCNLVLRFVRGFSVLLVLALPGFLSPPHSAAGESPQSRMTVAHSQTATPADNPEPLPENCIDVTPPGGDPPACCIYGYVYYHGEPVGGVTITIESRSGSVSTTTATGGASTHPYSGVDLSNTPLSASAGETITITASFSDMASSRSWVVQTNGQQVDLGLVTGYQGPGPVSASTADGSTVLEAGQAQTGAETQSGACYAQIASTPTITYTTVQMAVDAAMDGDTVKVAGYCDGVEARAELTQTVYISKSLILRGGYTTTNWTESDPVAHPTTLDAQRDGRVAYVTGDKDVTIENLRITGGAAEGRGGGAAESRGGGIYSEYATLTLSNTVVISNSAGTDGGGVCVFSGSATFHGGQILDNTAPNVDDADGGGVYIAYGDATFDGVQITGNSANLGGGVFARETVTSIQIDDSTITHNIARNNGGGVILGGGSATLTGGQIASNEAEEGGGVHVAGGSVTVSGAQIIGNSAANGGGVFVSAGSVTLNGSTVLSNTAQSDGGGLCMSGGSVMLDGGQIAHNSAPLGGGVYVGNQATFAQTDASIIAHNRAEIDGEDGGKGGGLYVNSGHAMLGGGQIINNTALTDSGGGVYVTGDGASLSGGRIIGNSAVWGGGVVVRNGSAALIGNTILSNSAYKDGGGLHLDNSTVTITNTIVADNQAGMWPGVRLGSGLYVRDSSLHSLHATIARNRGGDGSGIHVTGTTSTAALTNTILVGHTLGVTVTAGNAAALEATLWGSDAWANGTDWAGAGTTITGTHNYRGHPAFVDPDAGDYHIGPGSGAIDRGVSTGVKEDIDGDQRPLGEGPDLGADEFSAIDADFIASPLWGPVSLTVNFGDESRGDIIAWDWTFGDGGISGARHPEHEYTTPGTYTVSLTITGPAGSDTETKTDYIQVESIQPDWTFILYLAGDNNLEYWLENGLHKAESAADNPYVRIVALLDGDENGDTRRYEVQPDGDYTPGVDYWEMGEQDMGDPQTLADFVNWARENYLTDHYYLAVSNHGGGTRGIAWEYYRNPNNITRLELETALSDIVAHDPTTIDVVHYDACLMSMAELAYQLKDYADYFIASENLGWSIFAYDLYVAAVDDATTPHDLADQIADEYFYALPGHPRTITAMDLSAMDDVASATNALAQALIAGLPTYKEEISQTWAATQKLDSRYYLVIDNDDEYVDLYHFADLLEQNVNVPAGIQNAAQGVVDAIGSPDGSFLVEEHHESGSYGANYWDLDNTHGLSLYFPPHNSVWGYTEYINGTLPFVSDMQWDEFLQAYFGEIVTPPDPPPGVPPMPVPSFTIYLPLVVRSH